MKIWKYTLNDVDVQTIEIPKGAKLLTLQLQNGDPTLWALVDDTKDKEKLTITIYATGEDILDEPGLYIGTFQTEHSIVRMPLVFHVFGQYED